MDKKQEPVPAWKTRELLHTIEGKSTWAWVTTVPIGNHIYTIIENTDTGESWVET